MGVDTVLDPPSYTVVMDDGGEVGTEGHLLKRASDWSDAGIVEKQTRAAASGTADGDKAVHSVMHDEFAEELPSLAVHAVPGFNIEQGDELTHLHERALVEELPAAQAQAAFI